MADDSRSPLAPLSFPDLPTIKGVRFGTGESGIRYRNRPDFLVVELAPGTTIAGTLTRSLASSAPVDWCRQKLAGGHARIIVVNAGNANAFTGRLGVATVERMAAAAAQQFDCPPAQIFIASTGVIGEPLDDAKLTALFPALKATLDENAWPAAARAIMTTDTFPKGASALATIDGVPVAIAGIAKGSGMIAPDMATMLGFVFTDAAVPAPVLHTMLTRAVDRSFNCVTVDGDTSTSDTLLFGATGQAGNSMIDDPADPRLRGFRRALETVLTDLARQIVRDGEGAQKLITIDISGAASFRAARRIGLTIANSPLVKTAIAGEDANWGRIVAAVGRAGERADRDRLRVSVGGVVIAAEGQRVEGYDETPVTRHIKGRDIHIAVDVGIGRGKATVWTCDLTKRYIDINAGYRS